MINIFIYIQNPARQLQNAYCGVFHALLANSPPHNETTHIAQHIGVGTWTHTHVLHLQRDTPPSPTLATEHPLQHIKHSVRKAEKYQLYICGWMLSNRFLHQHSVCISYLPSHYTSLAYHNRFYFAVITPMYLRCWTKLSLPSCNYMTHRQVPQVPLIQSLHKNNEINFFYHSSNKPGFTSIQHKWQNYCRITLFSKTDRRKRDTTRRSNSKHRAHTESIHVWLENESAAVGNRGDGKQVGIISDRRQAPWNEHTVTEPGDWVE